MIWTNRKHLAHQWYTFRAPFVLNQHERYAKALLDVYKMSGIHAVDIPYVNRWVAGDVTFKSDGSQDVTKAGGSMI